MSRDLDHQPPETVIRTERPVYDPGPSGTAVAGLIIALIALAVGMYAAFAPRATVRENSEAVTASYEQAVQATERAAAERKRPEPAASQEERDKSGGFSQEAAEEIRHQLAALRTELRDLRERIEKPEGVREEPMKKQPADSG